MMMFDREKLDWQGITALFFISWPLSSGRLGLQWKFTKNTHNVFSRSLPKREVRISAGLFCNIVLCFSNGHQSQKRANWQTSCYPNRLEFFKGLKKEPLSVDVSKASTYAIDTNYTVVNFKEVLRYCTWIFQQEQTRLGNSDKDIIKAQKWCLVCRAHSNRKKEFFWWSA